MKIRLPLIFWKRARDLNEEFLRLRVGRSEATVSGYRRPLGFQQILTASLVTATKLTVPTPPAGFEVGFAIVQCVGTSSTVMWRDDGVAPTSTIGMTLASGQELDYSGDIYNIQFINGVSTNTLNISYYT